MEYRRLGKSGLKISALSFGSWVTFGNQIDEPRAMDMLKIAYEAGVNFFDNAEAYAEGESERLMGAALKKLAWGRDTFCVSSKVFWGGEKPTQLGLSKKHVTDACHAALKRLNVEYLDLYYCHRPDIQTPVEETVWAMNDLIRQGKVLYWGTSEWSAQAITEAHRVARENHLQGPTMEQPEYNLFTRQKVEADFLPLYETHGLGTTTWSPLASGVLTGKYNQGIPKDSRFNVAGFQWLRERYESEDGLARIGKAKKLAELAQSVGISLTHLSLAWCLKNPHVSSVILGASKSSQLQDNLKGLDALPKLTPEVMKKIEKIVQTKPAEPEDFT
ncbi:MAG: potassium channel beta subunit family protein [Bdellovibrionota bacterium]